MNWLMVWVWLFAFVFVAALSLLLGMYRGTKQGLARGIALGRAEERAERDRQRRARTLDVERAHARRGKATGSARISDVEFIDYHQEPDQSGIADMS
jgi:hypothetical protein